MALGGDRLGSLPLPIAGTGVILLMSALILVCGGVLGELVYKLGDMREQRVLAPDRERLESRSNRTLAMRYRQ